MLGPLARTHQTVWEQGKPGLANRVQRTQDRPEDDSGQHHRAQGRLQVAQGLPQRHQPAQGPRERPQVGQVRQRLQLRVIHTILCRGTSAQKFNCTETSCM